MINSLAPHSWGFLLLGGWVDLAEFFDKEVVH